MRAPPPSTARPAVEAAAAVMARALIPLGRRSCRVEAGSDMAQTFHLPIVYLVDCPGFLIGLEAERTGTIKQGVRAMSAIWQTTVPCAP